MSSFIPRPSRRSQIAQFIALVLGIILVAAPLSAQQRRAPAPVKPLPTFDDLLSVDAYEVYGEVRNVGQLLSTGGAGEIVDPIMKLAEPPKEFQSIIKFLKTNSESLATARLLFATSPALTEIPETFVAIEFPSQEEADKFAPKLEKFLPQILPPVPDATPTPDASEAKAKDPAQARASERGAQPAKPVESEAKPSPDVAPVATPVGTPQPVAEHLPFVITHSGNLVCISDKPFKFEKLHPAGSKPLAEDQNFRIAHDRFPSESVFLYFNVALQSRAKPQPSPKQQISEEEAERMRQEVEQERAEAEAEMARVATAEPSPGEPQISEGRATLRARVIVGDAEPSPTPTPTKEVQAQIAASAQIGQMLDFLGRGASQWPEAVGVALTFENNEYVIRAILVEAQNAKRLTLPFVPQLISGPAYTPNAPSVLPDDTEVFVSASIDLMQTHEGMRKLAEISAKDTLRQLRVSEKDDGAAKLFDPFAEFERKARFKIKEDLLPVVGNEIALAGSLSTLQGLGAFGIPSAPPSPKASPETADDKQKAAANYPVLLISIKDRDAARPLLPHVFEGLGIGEANLIAQTEKRGDTELVNYAGVFAYAFVGDFLVISEAATVRRVIDANINHQTLSSNSAFRNFRRWQPRQILGEVYVSPALMEGYQDAIRKQSATTMDEKMRDFLMQLSPTANAISYALTNEGFGEVHELHLPKNLIIAMVAGTTATASAMKEGSPEMDEMMAESLLRMIAGAEAAYKETAGSGSYGSLDQMIEAKLIGPKEMFDHYGYKFEVTALGDHFEATAMPVEYGKTGKRSFFVDQTGVVRGDDHGGGPANALDKPAQGP